uniref:Uncharacterized protein n=1 Tax=Anguilla anguilla TaxID=7936 RepID=A0A0E9PK42_ANGAN
MLGLIQLQRVFFVSCFIHNSPLSIPVYWLQEVLEPIPACIG